MTEATALPRAFPLSDDEDPARQPAGVFIEASLRRLVRGVRDRRSGFHVIGLATTGADGAPRLRSVVLRSCDPAAAAVGFHTDARSPKFAELARDPRAAILAYDGPARLQIRLEGRVSLHRGDETGTAIWRGMQEAARQTYRGAHAPGMKVAPSELDCTGPEAAAAAHFVACRLAIATIDVLWLRSAGHRRAIGRYDGDARLTAHWVAA